MQTFSQFLSALATKSLATPAGPTGGYLVPAEHSTRIFALAASISLVRPRAVVLPMTTRTLEVPLPDLSTPADAADSPLLSAVTVRWNAENDETPAATPSFTQAALTDYSLTGYTSTSAGLPHATADAVLTSLFAHALAWASDRAFLRGSGVGQPRGLLPADATTPVGAASGANDPHRRVGRRTKSGGV